jgi:hypothetical protein
MPPVGFEPAIPASERPQTHALDRAATGIGNDLFNYANYSYYKFVVVLLLSLFHYSSFVVSDVMYFIDVPVIGVLHVVSAH